MTATLTATQARQIRHALTALTRTTPGRRRVIQAAAEEYLSQIDRRILPMGYDWHFPANPAGDRRNRGDAFRMRRGNTFARMLGIACQPTDPHLPLTARVILAEIDAPVRRLTAAATASGQPLLVATLHLIAA